MINNPQQLTLPLHLLSSKICAYFCLMSVFLLSINVANGQSSEAEIIPEQALPIIRIALPEQKILNAAVGEKFDSLVNFLKEYWQVWGIDHKYAIEFVRIQQGSAYQALKEKRIDIAAVTVFNENVSDILLSIPYAKYKQRFFRRVTPDESNGIQIGIHTSAQEILTFLGDHIDRQYYDNIDDLLANYTKFDALYSTQPWLLHEKLSQLKLTKHFFVSKDEAPNLYLHAATRAEDRDLLYAINESLRAVNKSQAQLWTNKYLQNNQGNFSLTLGHYFTNLSEAEKRYAIDHNLLTFPIDDKGLPPYVIPNSFTNITERGLVIDLTNIITEKTGLLFRPLYVENKKIAIKSLNDNHVDILLNIDVSATQQQEFAYTVPYLTRQYSIFYRRDYYLTTSLDELNDESIAIVKNVNPADSILTMLPNATIKEYQTIEKAILAVSRGEVNAYIGRSLTTAYLIKEKRLSNLTGQPIPAFNDNAQFTFATLNENTDLILLLNRTIKSISANKIDNLVAKWNMTNFNNRNIKEGVDVAYQQASYVLAGISGTCLIIFWIYYRQLRLRKMAQQKAEQALVIAEEARKEAEKSAQAKITFLARMSHEIRTPMNGVFGMAEALSFTPLNIEQQDLLDTLKNSARNLLALLNDVLDFSKMDAGKLTLESVSVNFHQLTKNIMASFIQTSKKEQLALALDIDEEISHCYFTDPTRLTQVLNNLISNAMKFTEKGSICISINLEQRKESPNTTYDTLRFSVKDTGIGIAKKNQALLFTPFKQADVEVTRKYGGTGLGLSICQEIVNAMGGKIALESVEGCGSDFSFSLTLKQAGFEQAAQDRRKNQRSQHAEDDNRFSDIRVLIAEDNLINIKVLSAQLERLNIIADVAEDGAKALELHALNQYDIIISDCHMPILDGFELAKQLTQTPQEKPIWLIAITADALSGSAEKCLTAGFDDYMAKPCPQEEITNKVNHAYRQLTLKRKLDFHAQDPQTHFQLFEPHSLLKSNDLDIVLTTRIAKLFIDSWTNDKVTFLSDILAKDFDRIYSFTHKTRGSIRYLCLDKLEACALKVESTAQTKNNKAMHTATKDFVKQLDLLADEINQWLLTLP